MPKEVPTPLSPSGRYFLEPRNAILRVQAEFLQGLQYENLDGNWGSCWLTSLCELQICGKTVGDLIAVDDMHQRKAEMARRADAFIALPGNDSSKNFSTDDLNWNL
jgi:hypothetical protein